MSTLIGLIKFPLLLVMTTSVKLDTMVPVAVVVGLHIILMTHYGMDKTVLLVARAVN